MDRYKNMSDEELQRELERLQSEETCSGSCSSCASSDSCSGNKVPTLPPAAKKVVAVLSGKGGTGKTVVTALLANGLAARGLTVGILDADLANPCLPYVYGLTEPADSDAKNVFPMVAENGVRFISMANIHDKPESPLIWYGKDIANGALFLYTDVKWTEDGSLLDVLLLDMPTGIGDVPLQLYTTLPMTCSVLVSTPDDLAERMAVKSVALSRMLYIPVAGLVMNKVHLPCPECGFGISLGTDSQERAERIGVPLAAELPYSRELSVMADMGRILDAEVPQLGPLCDSLAEIIREEG